MSMLVALDVDGVVAAFIEHILATSGSTTKFEEIVSWDFLSHIDEVARPKAKQLLLQPDWWLTIPVIAGAEKSVDQLRSVGCEIVWCTAPWRSCIGWETARREWLKRKFDVAPDEVLIGERKEIIAADLLIDDKPETVAKFNSSKRRVFGAEAWLFSAPWNKKVADAARVVHGDNGFEVRRG